MEAAARLGRSLELVAALVWLADAPFCLALDIAERGAYFYAVLPLVAGAVAVALDGWDRRLAIGLLATAVVVAGIDSASQLRAWERSYPGHEWAELLVAEAGEDDLVFAQTYEGASAVYRHSELTVFSPYTGGVDPLDVEDPALQALALRLAARRKQDGAVFVTRAFLGSEESGVRRIVAGLHELFGPPELRAGGAYAVFRPGTTD